MSTRLGWAGWGKGRGGEDSAFTAQASTGLCAVGSHCEPQLLLPPAFLPSSYPFGKCETEAHQVWGWDGQGCT